jgi:hypothetical protein
VWKPGLTIHRSIFVPAWKVLAKSVSAGASSYGYGRTI